MGICPTPHINAHPGDFAHTVLMPGDPLRSRFVAENFLTDAHLVNNVRSVYGYTGTYKGKSVSVMASVWECRRSEYILMSFTTFSALRI